MADTADTTQRGSGLSRRGFLGLSAIGLGMGMGSTAWGPWPGAAVGSPRSPGDAPLRFVVLTDTHANHEETARLENLRRVFAVVDAEQPQFVLHCGDITDYGSDEEFAAYRATIPDGLWDRLRHAPGNHEIRWDTSARERFQRWFGPTSYSFDAGGVHFVALDPTQALQEPGLFGDDLEHLRDDLSRVGERPTVMFLHYPLAGRNYYVNDADAFLRTIDPFPVRGIFAGHIHRNEIDRFNGLTQVAAVATRSGPFYLRVTQVDDGDGRRLVVEQVTLGATDADAPTVQPLTEMPLDAPPAGAEPIRIAARPRDTAIALTAVAGRAATAVEARVHPQAVFGAAEDGVWTPLAPRGASWHGAVDAAALAAGVHRVQLRATDAAGGRRYDTAEVDRRGVTRARPAWELAIGGQLQGALAARGATVVAGSTSGRVAAIEVEGSSRHRRRWTADLGPVHRGAAFTTDGALVCVPGADHRLTALDARTGAVAWVSSFDKPVMSTPAVFATGEGDRIVVAAEDRLRCLDDHGATLWEASVPVLTAGRAASDGARVFVGAGDGRAYAYDLGTGEPLWSFLTNERPDAYRRLIYGPWDDWIEVLPTGAVLVSTVTHAIAIDPVTGGELWRVAGSHIYAPSVMLPDGGLLLTTEWGVLSVLDPATGAARWSAQAVPRAFNAGPALDPRDGTVWLVSVGGLLVAVDSATGTVSVDRQLFTANTFSTPVIVGEQLVVAAQDGVLRGLTI
ncbi:PQQ-binding-like beta-propeller repeat protein [Microbacterium sp. HD4P20]|uniref:outer membrane protein assembly factor BamB family protein n=1 Tax=Microbacterium sp. HD4P20 TaxID=2864874 RepID=UPI001C64265E|nr:PQQ-binding-like beta-propeller repeat protein [Microbacterium sp. HD4P20]MCP2635479.1 PQQ-binding-like beta-propeller repeat protein [Microbacterium sp. HD4P20]